jgi:hypothetical protein
LLLEEVLHSLGENVWVSVGQMSQCLISSIVQQLGSSLSKADKKGLQACKIHLEQCQKTLARTIARMTGYQDVDIFLFTFCCQVGHYYDAIMPKK